MDADDLPPGEEPRQGVEGDSVVRIVEGRHEHKIVGDVEIRVAGRQALAVEMAGAGMGCTSRRLPSGSRICRSSMTKATIVPSLDY